ncbi:MAG TPA: DUF3179 domain-containing (seleno)protein [Thermoanaerobaculaceae bacterium]|nr:DUF3179 domain-containing (seleno)protein [Thermoanaerobaculaceae bacterium]HRS15236.1 DUF3179 domain-containing (seleno)protein [Thermoanaerobaculaceae bacterium]
MSVFASPRRPGFLASGGWVLLLAMGLVGAITVAHLAKALRHRSRATGDGRDPRSYGFAMQPALVPTEAVVAAGLPKDGLPALHDPRVWTLAEFDAAAAARRRGKLLVGEDRVIGVVLGGKARAYPLRVLVWHEVVNDSLGGVPILVSYHALSGAAVVARRPPGKVFGFSGLLLDSSALVYERTPAGTGESLWSPLLLAAVTGPAVGTELEPLPSALVTWRRWRENRPDTTVLAPDPRLVKEYRREPYVSYLGNDELRFPVRRELPPELGLGRKTPVLAVRLGGRWLAVPHPVAARRASAGGVATLEHAGTKLEVRLETRPPTLELVGSELPTVHAFAFAWHALHPDDTDWLPFPPSQ